MGKYLEVDFWGKELAVGKSAQIEWLEPVYAGAVLTGKATATNAVRRSEKNGLVEIKNPANKRHGQPVLTDVTEAIIKCRRQ